MAEQNYEPVNAPSDLIADPVMLPQQEAGMSISPFVIDSSMQNYYTNMISTLETAKSSMLNMWESAEKIKQQKLRTIIARNKARNDHYVATLKGSIEEGTTMDIADVQIPDVWPGRTQTLTPQTRTPHEGASRAELQAPVPDHTDSEYFEPGSDTYLDKLPPTVEGTTDPAQVTWYPIAPTLAPAAMGAAMGAVQENKAMPDIDQNLVQRIKENEGMKLQPYRLSTEANYTIGVGHYLDGSPGSRKMIAKVLPDIKYKDIKEGRVSLTEAQADQLMRLDIVARRKQTTEVLKGGKYKWEELPQDLRHHLIDATFRGSFIPHKNKKGQQIGSPATIKLIKAGKFREAAKEFINRSDYREAKTTGVNRGIINRMDAIYYSLLRAAEYFDKVDQVK